MLNPYIDKSKSPEHDATDPENYDQLPPSSTMIVNHSCDCFYCNGITPDEPINTYAEDFAL